jgi:hypothetical protein
LWATGSAVVHHVVYTPTRSPTPTLGIAQGGNEQLVGDPLYSLTVVLAVVIPVHPRGSAPPSHSLHPTALPRDRYLSTHPSEMGGSPLWQVAAINPVLQIVEDVLLRSRGQYGPHQVYPALPCPALPCPALPCPALPCVALPCPALRYTRR